MLVEFVKRSKFHEFKILILFFFLSFNCISCTHSIGAEIQVIESPLSKSRISCVKENGKLWEGYEKILFIKNKKIIDYENSGVIYEIFKDRFKITEIKSQTSQSTNVAEFISTNKYIDVKLNFAIYNGNIIIHWKETNLNKSNMFGVIEIKGYSLKTFCRGVDGVDVLH